MSHSSPHLFLLLLFNSFSFYHCSSFFFFFNDTATTEIYTLSLHDALPISDFAHGDCFAKQFVITSRVDYRHLRDRKSTRLNSSHGYISYAVFCLKKKKKKNK